MPQNKLHIAMLEDDSDDRYLTKELTAGLEVDLKIDFFSNSNELFRSVEKINPQLILVNDNSTPENGIEVLRKIKNNKTLHSIPVVILSDSIAPKYRQQCYEAGASAFVIKPSSLMASKEKIKSFFTYWTEVAEL